MPSLQETSMNPSLQEITEEISHSNPLPGLSERVLLENPDFYNVWKGKMYIQGKLVCDIALQSSTNYSIPAQLPEKLEIRDVIRLSDLRQKLPEDIFERLDFSGKEVCCGEVYCSLYQLRASNVVGLELYKLQTLMKDKDLAVVKLLNDQGFLIFITSTLVKASKDVQHSDSSCLAALFLFPHTRMLDSKESEQWEKDIPTEDVSVKVTSVLPGLQYAIMETSRTLTEQELFPDALERCFKKFATLQKKKEDTKPDLTTDPLLDTSPEDPEKSGTEKCNQGQFARLQSYISSPVDYCVSLQKASNLLAEDTQPPGDGPIGSEITDVAQFTIEHIGSEITDVAQSTIEPIGSEITDVAQSTIEPIGSEITDVAQSTIEPIGSEITDVAHSTLPSETETGVKVDVPSGLTENELLQESTTAIIGQANRGKGSKKRAKRGKRRRAHQAASLVVKPGGDDNQGRTTVKLASANCSQGRKRGAEVLTAQFVQDLVPELAAKKVPIKRVKKEPQVGVPRRRSERTPVKRRIQEDRSNSDRPSKRKASGLDELPGDKIVSETRNQVDGFTIIAKKIRKPRKPTDTIKKTRQVKSSSKPDEKPPGIQDAHVLEKRIHAYESLALNMLADLALNAYNSSNIPYAQTVSVVSEDAGLGERVSPDEKPVSYSEYPMVSNTESFCNPPVHIDAPSSTQTRESAQAVDPYEFNSDSCDEEDSSAVIKESRKKPKSQKSPGSHSKAKSHQTNKICLEHSYSQLPPGGQTIGPISSTPEPIDEPVSEPDDLPHPEEVAIEPPPPPPETQPLQPPQPQPPQPPQNNVVVPAADIIFLTSTNQVIYPVVKNQTRSVLKIGDKYLIKFACEGKYDFDLDSKFTSDDLEKTVNRALHGPWNPNLREKVEDVKIILHMWLALFYSKSNKHMNRRTRKVVEHSNPAKYVSINTALDPFELYKFVQSESLNIGLTPLPPAASSSQNSGASVAGGNAMNSLFPGKLPLAPLPRIIKPEKIQVKSPLQSLPSVTKVVPFKGNKVIFQRDLKSRNLGSIQPTLTPVTWVNTRSSSLGKSTAPVPSEEKLSQAHDGCIPIMCYMGDSRNADTDQNATAGKSVDLIVQASVHDTTTEISDSSEALQTIGQEVEIGDEADVTPAASETEDHYELFDSSHSPGSDIQLDADFMPSGYDKSITLSPASNEPESPNRDDNLFSSHHVEANTESLSGAITIETFSKQYYAPENVSPAVEVKIIESERREAYALCLKEISSMQSLDTTTSESTNREEQESREKPEVETATCEIPPNDSTPAKILTAETEKTPGDATSDEFETTEQEPNSSIESSQGGSLSNEDSQLSICNETQRDTPAVDNADISAGTEIVCKTKPVCQEEETPVTNASDSQLDGVENGEETSREEQDNTDLAIPEEPISQVDQLPVVASESLEDEKDKTAGTNEQSNLSSEMEIIQKPSALCSGTESLTVVIESSNNENKSEILDLESKTKENYTDFSTHNGTPDSKNQAEAISLSTNEIDNQLSVKPHMSHDDVETDSQVNNTNIPLLHNEEQEGLNDTYSEGNQPSSETASLNAEVNKPPVAEEETLVLEEEKLNKETTHECQIVSSNLPAVCSDPVCSGNGQQTLEKGAEVHVKEINTTEMQNKPLLSKNDGGDEVMAGKDNSALKTTNNVIENINDKLMDVTSGDKVAQAEEDDVVILDSNTSMSSADEFQDTCGLPLLRRCLPYKEAHSANIENATAQEPSDNFMIANIASISEEQYERWADEDISQVNKTTQKPFPEQEYCQMFSRSASENTTYSQESTCTTKEKSSRHSQKRSSSRSRLRDTEEYYTPHYRENIKESGRTLQNLPRDSKSDHVNLFANKRTASKDLTQDTVDLEHLRFIDRLKELLRKTSTYNYFYEPPYRTMFDSRRIEGNASSTPKNISPLLITVKCSRKREPTGHDRWYSSSGYTKRYYEDDLRDSSYHEEDLRDRSYYEDDLRDRSYYEDELRDRSLYFSRTFKKSSSKSHRPFSQFHFNRLNYEKKAEDPESDISDYVQDSVQSSHLRLSKLSLGNTIDRTSAKEHGEENAAHARRTLASFPKQSHLVNIISDHCSSLQSRLSSVVKESGKKNFRFYISETCDDQFFPLAKNLLKKDGHTPVEPQHFCYSQHVESDRLLVIIRNEDISSHIHKIPCLLQLKLLPNVTFAGVDTPEDIMESTYEELFQSGGFVFSDPALLETITLGKLKEVLTVLEKMNKTSGWKWLIHYKENRRLKEDKRPDSVSQVKIPLLKSYQQTNIIEVLPYHLCDSTAKGQSQDLVCALTLQSQHIHYRLAVYLTDKSSSAREEFEENGILTLDVDEFIRSVQKLDARFHASSLS